MAENVIDMNDLRRRMEGALNSFKHDLSGLRTGRASASVLGSTFSRYKAPALVNLDWTTTFTPALLRKDLDLGLAAGRKLDVPMPVTAAMREALQAHIGAAQIRPDPEAYLAADFSALIETVALGAGVTLESENKRVASGLETSG